MYEHWPSAMAFRMMITSASHLHIRKSMYRKGVDLESANEKCSGHLHTVHNNQITGRCEKMNRRQTFDAQRNNAAGLGVAVPDMLNKQRGQMIRHRSNTLNRTL